MTTELPAEVKAEIDRQAAIHAINTNRLEWLVRMGGWQPSTSVWVQTLAMLIHEQDECQAWKEKVGRPS